MQQFKQLFSAFLVALLLSACSAPSYGLRVSPNNTSEVFKVFSGRELAGVSSDGMLTWVGGYVEEGDMYLWVAQRNTSNHNSNLNPSEITIRYKCDGGRENYYRAVDPNDLVSAQRRQASSAAAWQSMATGLNANNAATRTKTGCAYGIGEAYGSNGYTVAEAAACESSKEIDPIAKQIYLNSQSQQIQNQYTSSISDIDRFSQTLLYPATLGPSKEIGGWVSFGKPPDLDCAQDILVQVPSGGGLVQVALMPNNRDDQKSTVFEAQRQQENHTRRNNSSVGTESVNDTYASRGDSYQRLGQNDLAIENYNKAIELDPNNVQAFYSRGVSLAFLGKFDRAIDDFSKAIELDPKNAGAYYYRGASLGFLGQHDRAIEDCNKAIELDPKNANAYYNRGTSHANLRQYDRAIVDFNKAIELDPKNVGAYYVRGIAFQCLRQSDRAIIDFNKAIELDPKNSQAYFGRGAAYNNLGQYDRACEDFNKAINLDPKYAYAFYFRGVSHAYLRQYQHAIDDFNMAIEINPKNEYFYLHVINTAIANNLDQKSFEKKLSSFIATNPSSDWVRTISKYYLGLDGITETKVLEEAKNGKDEKEINGRLCEAYYYLGEKWLSKGDRNKALEYFSYSISTNVQEFDEYAQSMEMLKLMRDGKR